MRFAHLADVHLDRAFRRLGAHAAVRRQEVKATFERAVAYAAKEADVLLVAGDLFEDETVTTQTLTWLRAMLAGALPVVIAPGNHDPLHARSPYRELAWPGNVHIFGVSAEIREVAGLRIAGRAFAARREDGPAFSGLTGLGPVDIVLLHAAYVRARHRHGHRPFDRSEARSLRTRLLALGHVHQPMVYDGDGMSPFVYAGSPEPLDVLETGLHGLIAGQIGQEGLGLRLVPLQTRSAVRVVASATGAVDEDEITARLRAVIGGATLVDAQLQGVWEGSRALDKERVRAGLSDLLWLRLIDRSDRLPA